MTELDILKLLSAGEISPADALAAIRVYAVYRAHQRAAYRARAVARAAHVCPAQCPPDCRW